MVMWPRSMADDTESESANPEAAEDYKVRAFMHMVADSPTVSANSISV